MKKLIFTLVHLLIFTFAFAQAPQSFEYQAVVRDASGNLLVNQAVGIQITIKQGSATGTSVYQETFNATTNLYGLINLQIGTGTTGDDFTTINWANGAYFLEVAIDVTGGTTYSVMGTSQLLSVPYALHAKTVEVNDACSLFSYYYADRDNDGFGDPFNLVFSCSQPVGYISDNTDCNDNEETVYPGAIEICGDNLDNNCDGIIDNGCCQYKYYKDGDHDGYGDEFSSIISTSTTPPIGYVSVALDCDDTNFFTNPFATDVLGNGIDEDCDGTPDFQGDTVDSDGDGWPDRIDCYPNNINQYPGSPETCGDNIDANCDGHIPTLK